MAKYPSTLLPQSNEPQEIQKAILDLLEKINQVSTAAAATPPGSIQMYGASTAPEGFLLCDGTSYRRVDYPALFAAIGSTFGAADAASFNVPDFRGVSPTGPGAQDINGRTKTGPNLGEAREDQGQGHYHGPLSPGTAIWTVRTGAGGVDGASGAAQGYATTGAPATDGTNGTPRTGAYTHGPEIGISFVIKT